MTRFQYPLAVACATFASLVTAQAGPNTLAVYNPANRTESLNATFCLLPVPKTVIKKISNYAPLDVPSDILPSFPQDMHPLILRVGYSKDIRMTALNLVPLQIPALMDASLSVPYLDVTKDGKTPITASVNSYVGGINGQDLQALVPALVAGIPLFEGTITAPAQMVPDTAAAESLPNGIYSFQVKPFILPNPLSGPGVVAEAVDLTFSLTNKSPYTAHNFHALINQPQVLDSGLCQRQGFYFNETFADPKMAIGTATLYHQLLFDTPAKEIAGTYQNVHCYSANAEVVSNFIGESCPVAAARTDPKSQE